MSEVRVRCRKVVNSDFSKIAHGAVQVPNIIGSEKLMWTFLEPRPFFECMEQARYIDTIDELLTAPNYGTLTICLWDDVPDSHKPVTTGLQGYVQPEIALIGITYSLGPVYFCFGISISSCG